VLVSVGDVRLFVDVDGAKLGPDGMSMLPRRRPPAGDRAAGRGAHSHSRIRARRASARRRDPAAGGEGRRWGLIEPRAA